MSWPLSAGFSGFSLLCPGGALAGAGDALQQVAQARDALDVNVKRTFIDPLQDLHNTELKEIRVRGHTHEAITGFMKRKQRQTELTSAGCFLSIS